MIAPRFLRPAPAAQGASVLVLLLCGAVWAQDARELCEPCDVDSHCGAASGDLCLMYSTHGNTGRCGLRCDDGPCPRGFECLAVERAGAVDPGAPPLDPQCVPRSGRCDDPTGEAPREPCPLSASADGCFCEDGLWRCPGRSSIGDEAPPRGDPAVRSEGCSVASVGAAPGWRVALWALTRRLR